MRTGLPKPSGRLLHLAAAIAMASMLYGCKGSDGGVGAQGQPGVDGQSGVDGQDGQNAPVPPLAYSVFTGAAVSSRGGIAQYHGQAAAVAEDELQGAPANPKYLAKLAITGATADAAGVLTVNFTVKGKDDTTPVTGLTAASAGVFKLVPAAASGSGRSFNRWVPYIYRSGRTVDAGYRESNGTLTDNGGGSYTYRFATNLSTARFLWDPTGADTTTTPWTAVGYDRTLTHRVSIYVGGHAGPTGEADYDFVPAGGAVTETRNIVETAACKKCHGWEFAGHGGDRVTVEGCNTCHSPDGKMVNAAADGGSTESIAMQVMIHKIHAGRELQSAPGPDGIFFDDPVTPADESADNGTYTVGRKTATWRSAAFPAGLWNCTVCHASITGTVALQQVDNWKTVPSREACGSCHDLVSFASGSTTHAAQASDAACAGCHSPESIVSYHAGMRKDPRNDPEFDVSVSVATPVRGYFVAGETPVVTVQLYDRENGNALIDHTTVVEDSSAEGCVPNTAKTACTVARDGKFRNANLYVTGPRAKRLPVLTTPARARVSSDTTGPWALTAGAALRVVVDGGNFIVYPDYDGESVLVPGDLTVKLPATPEGMGALFANPAAATAAEIVAWLNGPSATVTYNERTFKFGERALAYVENGKVSIRTRAKGSFNPSIQVPEVTNGLGLFTDTATKVTGSAAQMRQRTSAANNDPKFAWAAEKLTYTLDPVDDLAPGTYVVNVEFADRGRIDNVSYKTPSVAVVTFQVKTGTVEKPIADGCTACHWNTNGPGGAGFVMDYPRHDKVFDAKVVDQCGGCHEYASAETLTVRTWTTGGSTKAISKRVHSVHDGVNLTYPVLTVDHEESIPGRNWQITYPQSIKNCESCHSDAGTSGTWKIVPNRLACMGCHDTEAATNHMMVQVYDPTPTAPWSGDEVETCATCH